MATRNRTPDYLQYRSACKNGKKGGSFIELRNLGGKKNVDDESNRSGLLADGDIEQPMQSSGKPPAWVEQVNEIHSVMDLIKVKIVELGQVHSKHLLPTFDDEAQGTDDVDIRTQEITRLFHKAETRVKQIGTHKEDPEFQPRKNAQMAMAGRLQELSQSFRKSQKNYLNRLRGLQDTVADEFNDDDPTAYDRGMDSTQLMVLENVECNVAQREEEIKGIAKSIMELSEIFKELAVLVIDQGTLLDRIDYNIEMVHQKMEAAVPELRKAEEYQKKGKLTLCIMLLLVLIGIMLVVLVLKSVL